MNIYFSLNSVMFLISTQLKMPKFHIYKILYYHETNIKLNKLRQSTKQLSKSEMWLPFTMKNAIKV